MPEKLALSADQFDGSGSAAETRHTNIMQAIETFVPRSEIDKDNKAVHERIDGVEKRQDTMHKRI